jgi:hypothetical protein
MRISPVVRQCEGFRRMVPVRVEESKRCAVVWGDGKVGR